MSESYWGRLGQLRADRRFVLRGMMAGGAAALLSACASDEKSGVPASPGVSAQAAGQRDTTPATRGDFFSRIPENPPKDWDDKDIKTGGTLTRLYNRQVPLDFMTATGVAAEVSTPVYSRLIRLANRADLANVMQPPLEVDLATAWEQPDITTVIFTLVPNVKFHPVPPLNGRTLSVEDIRYSFNRGKTFSRSLYKSYHNRIQRVEDAGGGKIKLVLAEPYPAVLQLLTSFFMGIMPPEIGENPDLAQTTAVGTGGMMLVKNTPNVEFVYQKHPEYFKTDAFGRRRPYIDGYTLSVVPDEATRLALFESGKADFAYNAASPVTLDNVEDFARRNPKVVLQKLSQSFVATSIVGHADRAPWNDPRVRRAAALCVDQTTIINTIYRGQAITGPFFPWPYIASKPPVLTELGPNYVYDPAQAKQLLAAAGFADGLDLDLHWYTAGEIEQEVTLYQQSAAAAGLRFNLVKSPDVAAHNQKLTMKNWTGLIVAARSLNFLDPAATMEYYLPGSALNFGDVNDPVLMSLNMRMENTLGEERKAIARQIFEHLNAQVHDVGLPVGDRITAWWPRLKNWRDTAASANSGYGMGSIDQVWIE